MILRAQLLPGLQRIKRILVAPMVKECLFMLQELIFNHFLLFLEGITLFHLSMLLLGVDGVV